MESVRTFFELVLVVVSVYDASDGNSLFRLMAGGSPTNAHHTLVLLTQERPDQLVHV